MFRFISWGQYFTTMLILVIIYWLVIAALYFKGDLMQLFKRKKSTDGNGISSADEKIAGDVFTRVSELKLSLQQVFTQGAEKHWIKEELLMALRSAVQQSLELKGTAFQVAINNYIDIESKSQCRLELTNIEIQQLW